MNPALDSLIKFPLLPALIAFIAALAASLMTHFFTSRRDRKNEQRRQRASILLNAFSALLSGSNRPNLYEVGPAVEKAFAEVQALGTLRQIELAQAFARSLVKKEDASLDPLLAELREFLRCELDAEPIQGPIMWLRIEHPKNDA